MQIISRAAAGLPSPSGLSLRPRPWAGITWHHTGGNPTTWRAIHDWQTQGRPAGRLVYVGYSYGIGVDGRVTELRGWEYRPAGDHENSRIQVCFMGNWAGKLPPAAALNAAREFRAYAEDRQGGPLPGVAHRDVWSGGQYDTDCPGDALYAWVRDNLIGDDMPLSDADIDRIWNWNTGSSRNPVPAYQRLTQAAATATALLPKLDDVLAAARDDGNTTVILDPAALAVVESLRAEIAGLPEKVVDAEAARLQG